jgi:hypothetical protein
MEVHKKKLDAFHIFYPKLIIHEIDTWPSSHDLMMPSVSVSSSERKIMPIREMVAGEANVRSLVSNRKLTLGPNWIRHPDGRVSWSRFYEAVSDKQIST